MTTEEKTPVSERGGIWKHVRREPIGLIAALIALVSLLLNVHIQCMERPDLSLRNASVTLNRTHGKESGQEVWRLDFLIRAANAGRRAVGPREKGRVFILRNDEPVFSSEGFLRNPEPGQDRYDLTIEGLSERGLVLEVLCIVPRAQMPHREFSQERVKELTGQAGITYRVEIPGPSGSVWSTAPSAFNIDGTIIANRDDRTRVLYAGAIFESQPTTEGKRLEP